MQAFSKDFYLSFRLSLETDIMSLFMIVRNNHQEIMKAANALLDAVRTNPEAPDLGRLRMNLAHVVREKLTMQQSIFSQIDPAKRRQIAAFERVTDEDRELRLRYSQHVALWNSRTIEDDFAGYAASVEILVPRLERHLEMLEAEIYEPAFKLFDMAA